LNATITLKYDDEKTAEAIHRAVSPDNFETPPGLSVRTVRRDKNVITEINAETKIATFNATIDDLLFSVSTAEKALGIIKKSKP
jgi:tRNA threonylcarbamoyladenosine modification (KEOPS) complex  Pcc1 subunit